jgi:ribosomal protein L30E
MDYTKLTTYLGFAIKSGSAVFGLDGIKKADKIKVIIYSSNASENTVKEIRYYAGKKICALIRVEDADLGELVKRNNCKVIAVTDANLANGIITNYKQLSEDTAE